MEIAGEVDAIGPGVRDVKVGDRVFGIVGGGACAGAARRAIARTLAPIPETCSTSRRPPRSRRPFSPPTTRWCSRPTGLAAGEIPSSSTPWGSGVGTARGPDRARDRRDVAIGTARTPDEARAREGARPRATAS